MSPAAQELAARHFQHLASLTPDQRAALTRERRAEIASQRTGSTKAEALADIFELLAATP